jgi:hypothetical protein
VPDGVARGVGAERLHRVATAHRRAVRRPRLEGQPVEPGIGPRIPRPVDDEDTSVTARQALKPCGGVGGGYSIRVAIVSCSGPFCVPW